LLFKSLIKKIKENRDIVTSFILILVATLIYQCSLLLSDRLNKNACDAIAVLAAAVALVSLHFFIKYLKRTLFTKIKTRAGSWLKELGKRFGIFGNKVKRFFGVPGAKRGIGGEDERSFIRYRKESRSKNTKSFKKLPRYGSLADNCERMRFIYVKFVLSKIRSGAKFKRTETPDELSRTLCSNDSEKELVSLYSDARYGAGENISNDDINRMAVIVKLK